MLINIIKMNQKSCDSDYVLLHYQIIHIRINLESVILTDNHNSIFILQDMI